MIKIELIPLEHPLPADVESFGSGDTLYSSLRWNRAFSGRDAVSSVVVARDDRGAVRGTLLAHLMPEGSRNTVYDVGTLLGTTAHVAPRSAQLLLGARNGQWNGFRVAARAPSERAEVLNALVGAASSIAAVPAGFLYGTRADAAEVATAMGPDATLLLTEVNSTVQLGHGDFEAYTAGLPAKRRSDVRRDLEAAGGFPMSSDVRSDDAVVTAWAGLAAETQRRHGQPADAERLASYLRTCIDGAERAIGFWYGERSAPTAFALALVQDGVLWVRLVGLRYDEHGGTSGRYPGVLVFGPVRLAAAEGLVAVDLGAGLADFKGRRGARTEARWSAILPGGPAIDRDAVDARNAAEAARLGVELVGSGSVRA